MARSVLAGSSDGGGKRRLLTDWWCPHSLSLRSTLRLIRLDCPQRPTLLLATTLGPLGWGWGFTGTGRDNRFVSETFYPGNITVLYFHILCSTAEQSISTENFVQNKISFKQRDLLLQLYLLVTILVVARFLVFISHISYLVSHISYILSQTCLRFWGQLRERESAASPANHEAAGQPTNRKPGRLGWALLAWVITQAVESVGPGVPRPRPAEISIFAQFLLKLSLSPSPARYQRETPPSPSQPPGSVPLSVQAWSWCQQTLIWNQSQSIRSAGCREIIDFDNYLSLPARTSHISSLQTLHEAKF